MRELLLVVSLDFYFQFGLRPSIIIYNLGTGTDYSYYTRPAGVNQKKRAAGKGDKKQRREYTPLATRDISRDTRANKPRFFEDSLRLLASVHVCRLSPLLLCVGRLGMLHWLLLASSPSSLILLLQLPSLSQQLLL